MADERPAVAGMRVETTTDSRDAAHDIARSVIEHRLAACVQVSGPITSFYRWEGEVHADEEWIAVLKTSADRVEALTDHLVAVHDYDVPEVVAVPIEGGNPEYLRWLTDETRPST